ncbi:LysR family transcriptional regulator [Aliiroseovarius sp. KMU-50]|uniref:LysR family transcriptional regulator n=1 Tax=Aliiroseovarius salicola TaxID=3009082 RepID=A0ABT4VXX0_9RHOB|nr:LysR family transcriptional regulator [Aliiroseovarius sp. KMU-50]MDA5093113.1 LysR family transcriptional regulator [Aliiroseovarius sp. KMU-50]
MNNSNWDDIKFVLAVADEGSLNAAAQQLGVTHATVMRRVAAFERRCGRPLFQKSLAGYSVLPEAEAILTAARNVEDAIYSVDRAVHGTDETLSGTVRVASTDSLCQLILPPIIKTIKETYPELSISLLSANTYHDLSRLAADIAIRPTMRLEEGLEGKTVGELRFGIYSADPNTKLWIGLSGGLARSAPAKWMSNNIPPENISCEADSFLVVQEMVASGLGKAILPCFLGDPDQRLQRFHVKMPPLVVPVWSAIQAEVSSNVRIQLVRNLIAKELRNVI